MAELVTVTDNSQLDSPSNHPIVEALVNRDLANLEQENFLIFPDQVTNSPDLQRDNFIFTRQNGKTRTCNVVGILSQGEDELRIQSRFSQRKDDDQKENEAPKEDFFLRYMLQQVLNYNVVDSKVGASSEMSYYDLLVFLFPYYLNKALAKGLYKEYIKKQYNDANVKGSIEVARHIRHNIPFLGKVAYRTREFSYDNQITELIRHTIEKVQRDYDFILIDEDTKATVRSIKRTTTNYSRFDRQRVMQQNVANPVKHGYFTEYAALQRLCLQILNEELTGFGQVEDQIHGIIIDVAWLWEAYIWKVTGWQHYGKDSQLDTMPFYAKTAHDSQQHRYPDFVSDGIPIDTKYKRHLDKRNDYNQMTTYLHIMAADRGGFLQPSQAESGYQPLGTIDGLGGEMFTYRFKIPQECETYEDFVQQIQVAEAALKALKP